MTNKMLVYADSREPSDIITNLRDKFDVSVVTLDCGDLMATTPRGICLIERKTPQDLLSSISDGRLVSQSARMVRCCDAPVVIVHGDIKCDRRKLVVADGKQTKWSYWSMSNSLLSLQLAGLLVLIVPRYLYVDACHRVILWYSKETHMSKRRVNIALPTTFSRQVEFMSGITSIGPGIAAKILGKYGSPMKAIANVAQWASIKGVGIKSVNQAMKFLEWNGNE